MEIKGILVSIIAPMTDHIANGGEKILGNASSIKRRPDGRVYISGQKQRHAFFSAIDRLNFDDKQKADKRSKNSNLSDDEKKNVELVKSTYISNGDGVTNLVEIDIRADLGGFLHPKGKENYSGKRTAPLTATPAVALEQSKIGRDLLIRLEQNPNVVTADAYAKLNDEEKKKFTIGRQALATREFSQKDLMLMSFHIDVGSVGLRKRYKYGDGFHLNTEYIKHIDETERKRRVQLALEASASLTDYANNARNATSGEPQKVLIVFDTKLSRKASRYFLTENEVERERILAELKKRDAVYFLGDDTSAETDSVADAYEKAMSYLKKNDLFDPSNGAETMTTEQFENAQ
ncbi:MAG: type I-PGING CRISPR-associated protein Cas7/Csp1 [Pyrinomonadaceae bacterium]